LVVLDEVASFDHCVSNRIEVIAGIVEVGVSTSTCQIDHRIRFWVGAITGENRHVEGNYPGVRVGPILLHIKIAAAHFSRRDREAAIPGEEVGRGRCGNERFPVACFCEEGIWRKREGTAGKEYSRNDQHKQDSITDGSGFHHPPPMVFPR